MISELIHRFRRLHRFEIKKRARTGSSAALFCFLPSNLRNLWINYRNCFITSAAFWPPKPKLVETATRAGISRAVLGT